MIRGVSCHLRNDANDDANVAALAAAGITSIRDEITWSSVDVGGVMSLPSSHQTLIDIRTDSYFSQQDNLMILCYGHGAQGGNFPTSTSASDRFGEYCEFMVDAYKGYAKLYEIWNEPDIGLGNSGVKVDASVYVTLLKKVSPLIRAVDPFAKIIAGVISTFDVDYLQTLIELDALDYCDGLSLHPYIYLNPTPTPEYAIQKTDIVYEALRGISGQDFDMYLTEVGWRQDGSYATDSELTGRYLARAFIEAEKRSYIKGLWWYTLKDDSQQFGLLNSSNASKPALDYLGFLPGVNQSQVFYAWKDREKKYHVDGPATVTTKLIGQSSSQNIVASGERIEITVSDIPVEISGATLTAVPGEYHLIYVLASQTQISGYTHYTTHSYQTNTYYCYYEPIKLKDLNALIDAHPTAVYKCYSRTGDELSHRSTMPVDFNPPDPIKTRDGYKPWW